MQGRNLVIAALVVGVLGLAVAVYALTQQGGVEQQLAEAEARTDALQGVLEETQGVDLEVLTGAIEEGQLTWYTAAALEASSAQAEDFMNRYPFINVEVFRQTGGPLAERFLADIQRGEVVADALLHSDPAQFLSWAEEGYIADYTPAAAEAIPEDLKRFEPSGYPDRIVPISLVYNTDQLTPEEIQIIKDEGWEALANPAFQGRVGMIDPALAGSAVNHWYVLIQEWGEERVRALLEGIAENDPVFYESNVPASGAVGSGEQVIAPVVEFFAIDQVAAGAPVEMHWPDPSAAYYGIIGLVENAPNQNAAKLFIEWFMSEAGQRAWANNYNAMSAHPAVEDARAHVGTDWFQEMENPPSLERFAFADDLDAQAEYRDTLLAMFDEIFGQRQ